MKQRSRPNELVCSVSDAPKLRTLMRPQDEAHAKARAMIEGPVLARHAARRSIYVAWQRPPKARLVLALAVPMLPNKPLGISLASCRRIWGAPNSSGLFRRPSSRRGRHWIGSLLSRAFRDHEPGQRISGKFVEDVTIGTLCGQNSPASNFCEACQVISLNCSSRSRTFTSGSSPVRRASSS